MGVHLKVSPQTTGETLSWPTSASGLVRNPEVVIHQMLSLIHSSGNSVIMRTVVKAICYTALGDRYILLTETLGNSRGTDPGSVLVDAFLISWSSCL